MRTLFKKMGYLKSSGKVDYDEIIFDVVFTAAIVWTAYLAVLLKG